MCEKLENERNDYLGKLRVEFNEAARLVRKKREIL